MKIREIETPALILDRVAMEQNMALMDTLLEGSHMKLYPHYKSHKCPQIARMQMARGAAGITCAKLSEAEDLADAGIERIVIANQVVQPSKLARLAALSRRCGLTVCVDQPENILALEQAMAAGDGTLGVLVEFEIGMHRCGADPPEEFLKLAQLVNGQTHLTFEGIQAYAGHLAHERDLTRRKREMDEIEQRVRDLKGFVEAAGLPVREIAGGSTGTAALKPKDTVYTQLQTGSYLFMDCAYRALELPFVHALYLLTTVVSVRPDRIVTDGGVKSLGMDQGNPEFVGFPKDAAISMSEEHGAIFTAAADWHVNDKLRYIPGHCCTTINMADKLYVVEGERVTDVYPVVSRGKAQ